MSKSTVARALAGAAEASACTREKVARVAAELGYRPQQARAEHDHGQHRHTLLRTNPEITAIYCTMC